MVTAVTDLNELQWPFVRERNADEGPLLKTLQLFEISHGSYQPFNFLPYLTLPTQYSIFITKK